MSERPLQPETFGHAEVAVTDLPAAVAFHVEALGFSVLDSGAGVAHLSSDGQSVALVLREQENKGLLRLSYAIADADLTAFRSRLQQAGVPVVVREDPLPGVARTLELEDPDGYSLGLFVPGAPSTGAQPAEAGFKLLHPLLGVTDLGRTLDFYRGLLGFQVSDYIGERSAFLRCRDGYHHSVAFHQDPREPRIDHLCFLHRDFDSLMRARVRAQGRGKVQCTELLRHGGSESITFYFDNEHLGGGPPPTTRRDGSPTRSSRSTCGSPREGTSSPVSVI
jgi:2,3-dihydroxy-p-cumate/2,3-dihydroxybenzoate 3,4-dioxygenase